MVKPPVSVIMSVWNADPYLEESVNSIRQQSFGDFEFIIVDDGSTDGTAARLAHHASLDPRMTILSQENRGLVSSLNRALSAASGRLIARMDGDDISAPERLARQMEAFERAPDVVAIGTAYEEIDAQGNHIRQACPPLGAAAIRSTLERMNCMAHPTVMMQRDAVVKVGAYRRAFLHCEDYDLWLRLSEIGDLMNLPDSLLKYRVYSGKRTAKFAKQQTLSEMGARAAAARRRAGLADPVGDADLVTRDVLTACGVQSSTINFEIMRRALQNARRVAALGDRKSLHELLDLARSHKVSGVRNNLYYWLMRLKTQI
jgi:glycosyltransferase involved in cell wall biosynthesis